MSLKLSDYIMLGIGTVEHLEAGNMNACAVGIALNAAGVPRVSCHYNNDSVMARYYAFAALWPWTDEPATSYPPCSSRMHNWTNTIWYAFDNAVMRKSLMTIEQLADWVRSVEPECGECNSFKCICNTGLSTHLRTTEVAHVRTC